MGCCALRYLPGNQLCPVHAFGPAVLWLSGTAFIIAHSAGLSEADKEMLEQLQQASGACVATKFKANVTHVICGKLDKGLAK